jgi:ubiquinone/menaquinone biosynthesis C-methylase UbiE
MVRTPASRDIEELLDLGAGTWPERVESLRDLRRLNRYLGGVAASRRAVAAVLADAGPGPVTLLDVGTGSADVPAALQRWAREHGIDLRVVAVDSKLEHLQEARESGARMAFACADALRLPFPDEAVDLVHCALLLHHFRPPAAAALLREATRVARRAVIVNDLVRHAVPLFVLRHLAPLLVRSRITRHDGVASVLRAYTPAELAAIARAAGFHRFRLRACFPYRQCLVIHK